MLHCVHQLVSNWVCLLFAAEQVVYCGFLELFLAKNSWLLRQTYSTVRLNQNSKVLSRQNKTITWTLS